MKIVQMIKQLNNTELGKGGTHDTYVLIPGELDISCIFDVIGFDIAFIDKDTGKCVMARRTSGRETRIVGLGSYYREKGLCAGDEIVFERRESGLAESFYIGVKKHTGNLVVQKMKYGFEILTPERLEGFLEDATRNHADIEIEFLASERKRRDSPEKTDFYDIRTGGFSILDSYRGKECAELVIRGGRVIESSFYGWKKYTYEMEE